MAWNKNQHYVPQFYLRNFSSDEARRSVDLYNLARGKVIPRASIKNQCSQNYWHGDHDPIFEGGILGIEGDASAAIRATMANEHVHGVHSLTAYITLQLGRTVVAAEAFAENKSKLHELIFGEPRDVDLDPAHAIGMYVMHEPLLRDLAALLVVNRTDLDFITSDNPVALCNWWFHHQDPPRPGPGIGLAQAGLEIYLPLSPRHQLVLYDANIWTVPRANAGRALILKNEQDVWALNERQVLNAHHNLYFAASSTTEQHVLQLVAECDGKRKPEKMTVAELVQSKSDPNKFVSRNSPDASPLEKEKAFITTRVAIDPVRRVSFVATHFRPRWDDDHSAMGPLRDLAWVEILNDFRAIWKTDRAVTIADLDDYAVRHPAFDRVKVWKRGYWTRRN